MGQSRKASLVESITGRFIGFTIAILGQRVIFPLLGMDVNIKENLIIGVFFVTLGVCQNYAIRRLFNWIHVRNQNKKKK